jgi:hypothetical protein
MFQRDCGAATGFSTQVSVVARGDRLPPHANAFVADDGDGAATAGAWGGPWAEVRWLAPDRLLILYAARSRLFEQEEQVSGVRISYRQVAR